MKPSLLIRRSFWQLRHGGLPWLARTIYNLFWPARPALTTAIQAAVQDRAGLEIGGPSRLFSAGKMLPAYSWARSIDNVNFASQTAWETGLREGGAFLFDAGKPPGRQYLREASCLTGIADAAYDFVLSSHCLEHTANPLAALREWRRTVRPGGHLVLLLPDPAATFDHRRPVTTLEHLQADYAAQTSEADLTQLAEILSLHDLRRDPLAGTREQFHARSLRNPENRCLHHHVFDLALMRAALEETGWAVVGIESVRPIHLLALARNPA